MEGQKKVSKKIFNRKIILINPRFQYGIVGYFSIFFFILFFAFVGIVNFFFYITEESFLKELPNNNIFFEILNEQQIILNAFFIVFALFLIVLMVLGGFYLSHRIAGPIYRFKKCVDEQDVDNLKDITFRDNDYFPELAESFNDLIKKINDKKNDKSKDI